MDNFDIAYPWDIDCVLDGIPSSKLIKAMDAGDQIGASKTLNSIIELRDLFIEWNLWSTYSAAMNMLEFEGIHDPDWITLISPEIEDKLRTELIKNR